MKGRRRFALHITGVVGAVACTLYLMQNCGQRGGAGSQVQSLATANSLKTGLFVPRVEASYAYHIRAGARIASPSELAQKLGIALSASKSNTYRVSTTVDGENVLLIERPGLPPTPVASLTADGGKYQWSFSQVATEDGKKMALAQFVRHKLGSSPVPEVNAAGTETNIYFRRTPYNRGGVLEPMLISLLNNIIAPSGITIYRVGNVLIESRSNRAFLAYRPIGNQVWELAGYYEDADVAPGTIFWSPDLKTFYSLTPTTRKLTQWRQQDNDSMDRVGALAAGAVPIPKLVEQAVDFREKNGFGKPGKVIPIVGPEQLNPDAGTIPLYQSDAMLQPASSARAGLGLTDAAADPSSDAFYESAWDRSAAAQGGMQPSSTVDEASAGGFGLTDQLQPGSEVQVRNFNNGAYFPRARVVSTVSYNVPRGGFNQFATGKTDYQGQKTVFEVLDSKGHSTGDFIENTNNEYEGSSQRFLSRTQLSQEAQTSIQTREDTVRQATAQALEARQAADQYGAGADELANTAVTRAKQAPAKILVDAVATKIKPSGLSTTEEGLFAVGKEVTTQQINNQLGTQTGYDPAKVVGAGFGTYLSKTATVGLDGKALGTIVTDKLINQQTSQAAATLNGKTQSDAGRSLAIADGIVDVAGAGLGNAAEVAFGAPGKALVGAGTTLVKVGDAEVLSIGNSGAQLGKLADSNGKYTTGINADETARQGKTALDYLNRPENRVPVDAAPQASSPEAEPAPSPEVASPEAGGVLPATDEPAQNSDSNGGGDGGF